MIFNLKNKLEKTENTRVTKGQLAMGTDQWPRGCASVAVCECHWHVGPWDPRVSETWKNMQTFGLQPRSQGVAWATVVMRVCLTHVWCEAFCGWHNWRVGPTHQWLWRRRAVKGYTRSNLARSIQIRRLWCAHVLEQRRNRGGAYGDHPAWQRAPLRWLWWPKLAAGRT